MLNKNGGQINARRTKRKRTNNTSLGHRWNMLCTLLLKHLSDKKIDNKTPELGNYYLTDDELKNYSKYDFIIFAICLYQKITY